MRRTPRPGKPPRRSVRDRWFLVGKTQHVSIPIPALFALTGGDLGLNGEEMKVILWLLADWYWPGGISREVNAAVISQRAQVARPHVHRALAGLAAKGVIDLFRTGRGGCATVSIEPLIRITRAVASGGVPTGYSRQGRSAGSTNLVLDPPEVGTPLSTKPEPGGGTSEVSSSEYLRRASEVGAGEMSLPTASNGSETASRPCAPCRNVEHFQRESIAAQIVIWEREEAAAKARQEQAP